MVSMYGIGHMTANRIGIQDVNPKTPPHLEDR